MSIYTTMRILKARAAQAQAKQQTGGKITESEQRASEWFNKKYSSNQRQQELMSQQVEQKVEDINVKRVGGRRVYGSTVGTELKSYYKNPVTGKYSTQKVAGQKPITRTEAMQKEGVSQFRTTERGSSLSESEFRTAASLTPEAQKRRFGEVIVETQPKQTTQEVKITKDQSLELSQARQYYSTGEFQPYGSSSITLNSTDTRLDKPTQTSDIFITQPLVRKGIDFIETSPTGKSVKRLTQTQVVQQMKEDVTPTYEIVQKAPDIFAEQKARGKKVSIPTELAYKGGAKLSRTLKNISKEDIVLGTSAVVETALITLPTTRVINIAGGVARGTPLITKAPPIIKGGLTFGTYLAEAKLFGKVAEDIYGYGKTEEGKKYTLGVQLLQAESFANVEGGRRVTQLLKSGKKVNTLSYMKTRLFPGFIEAGVGYNVGMDFVGGTKDITIPFTDIDTGITAGGKGIKGLFPGKTKEGRFRTGRIFDTVASGSFGSVTAASFAGAEYLVKGSKKGRKIVAGLGYIADPAEAPGDIYTELGGVSGKVYSFTITPSVSTTTSSESKSISQTLSTGAGKTPQPSPSFVQLRTKMKGINLGALSTKSKVGSPSQAFSFTETTTQTQAEIPSLTPALTETKVPSFVQTNIPVLTQVPSTSFTFINPITSAMTFTPNWLIPPVKGLPGGGGGSGSFPKYRGRGKRLTKYQRSIVGGLYGKGKKRITEGLTGLEIRY